MPRTPFSMQYKWIVAVVFVCGMFLDIMDTTIVNVALPTLQRDFHTTTASIEWIVLGYLLSLAVWIPASGWIGDRIGTKKVFLFALATFTIASALCGQAHSLAELVGFRVLQGVGGGMLVPVGTAMLFRAFPPIERAKASTVLIIPTVLAPALGPVVGGWLVTDVSWRWIFYVNLPVGVFGFVVGALVLREYREGKAGRFDLPGFLLSGSGLALVLYALSEGPEKGWRSTPVVLTGSVGVLLFVLLVIVETHVRDPMLSLRLYRERMFRNANVVLTLTYSSFAGTLFILPLFLQELRGLSALESGLTTFPQAIGVIVSSQIVGRLYHRAGPRRLIVFGMVGMSLVTFMFVFVGLGTDLWWIRLIMFARGICMAFSFVPLQAATYANISPADTGRASAIYSTQRQVSAALGVAVLTTVLLTVNNGARSPLQFLRGYHAAFFTAACLVACAALSGLLIRDEDAAATLRGRAGSTEPALAAAGD
ncbi:MAG TPA: MDR family MFS transporter [Acidimicrobiia bacterium]|nr:MDR family MFS transporter [Acidimicrobiia bacterium]